MARIPIVTLTTDFGTASTWVGQMKGAILALHPDARIVDLTHEVPPHDVRAGGYLLESGAWSFPDGSIHVAVVDPGVGTARRPIVVRTERFLLVGPDNGIFSRLLDRDPPRGAFLLEASHYRRADVSATFEGRDVFAPAAAWLAKGTEPSNFGPKVTDLVRLPATLPPPDPPAPFTVPVVHVDRFGNAVLDVRAEALPRWVARTPGGEVRASRRTFAEGPKGEPFLLLNSSGYVEIALREGSAAALLGLAAGVEVSLSPPPA